MGATFFGNVLVVEAVGIAAFAFADSAGLLVFAGSAGNHADRLAQNLEGLAHLLDAYPVAGVQSPSFSQATAHSKSSYHT